MTSIDMDWDFLDEELAAFGHEVRREFAPSPRQVEDAAKAVLARINAAGTADTMQSRLRLLVEVVSFLCGNSTARRVLHAAAVGSPARSLDRLSEEHWGSFLLQLRSILTAMCGQSVAALVWEAGRA